MKSNSVVGVIDYQVGTWTSVVNMLEIIGAQASVCEDPEELSKFTHVVLPGVGNFFEASTKLDELGWRGPLLAKIESGAPTLGICLGMQLLGKSSEESVGDGLGVMNFKSALLSNDGPLRVPHMGWNSVQSESYHPIFKELSSDSRFYFVHSFAVPETSEDAVGYSAHNQVFTSVVARDNVVGVQFHPEKSRGYGKKLLENFVEM
jgi:glutamine amidotransferase